MNKSWLVVALAITAVFAIGCRKNKGDGGGAWAVGEDGTMLNVDADGVLGEGYDLTTSADFFGIACRGSTDAWVVGERGTLLRTLDAGASWDVIDVGVTSTLRAVAAAENGVVYVVGDGVALVSRDAGDSWRRISVPAHQLVGAATDAAGAVALLVSASGEIHHYDLARDEVTLVRQAGVGLRAVAMTGDRRHAVAAGDDGVVLESRDTGFTWQPLGQAISGTLHDVWLTAGGDTIYAVGATGALVTLDGRRNATVETLDAPGALRSIHMSASGAGMIVGDDGAAFRTMDFGASWQPVDMQTSARLHAVDDVHPDGHPVPHL